MASINDYDFPDEEEEDDFNPQAAVGSDDEDDDEKPHVNGDAGNQSSSRGRTVSRDRKDAVKDEAEDDDGMVGFGREVDESDEEKEGVRTQGNGVDEEAEEEDEDEDEDVSGRQRSGRDHDEGEDEDDEEEEEEDEDDDDIEGQPSRKRRRRGPRNQFIDVEAEVDEDDEEPDEDDDDLPGEEVHPDDLQELPPGADRDDRMHRELDRQRDQALQLDAEAEAERMRQRYGRQARAAASSGAVVPQRLLMPSVDGPKIWAVQCRPGKEREIIMALNERILTRTNSRRDPITIMSAFERGSIMPGYIYVEIMSNDAILPTLEGIQHVFMSKKPKLIPTEEMTDLLRVKPTKQIQNGMYVRMRKGLYQGDLAQVEEVDTNGTEITVRIVPRLDYGLNEDANAPAVELDANGKRKRQIKPLSQRPAQRLFSETEAKKRHGKYLSKAGGLTDSWTYQGKEYTQGFLIETVRLNQVQNENVNPTLEEVTKFAAGNDDGTENLDLAALAATLKQSAATDYLPGDKVSLFRGEQKGVEGRAVEVYGDVVKMRVESAGPLRNSTIEAPIKDLRKLFRDGDHVKVIGGSKYFDEVGMVVRTRDDRVTILTDSNQQEITVFSKDLREATDSGGNVSGSKFALFDLVQLDASTVGVVIKVDRESLRVLDQTGSVRNMLPSAISNKLEKRRGAVATDQAGNEMKHDDQIKEIGGEQKTGRVLHLHRNYIFVQNRERADNAGVFVAKHNNVVTVAARGGRQTSQTGLDLTKMNPAVKQNGAPGMGASAMLPPQQKGRDRWIGKSVKIRVGPHKGKVGIVKDASDMSAKVELHSQNKIVSVKKEELTQIDSHTGKPMGPPGGQLGSAPGGMPGRTPMPAYGRTPFGAAAGGRTPAYAMGASGGRTPSWKQDAGGRTPAYGGGMTAYGGQTSYGGGTSYGGATSYGGGSVWGGNQSTWNANPSSRTPAHNPGNKTPAYGGGLEAPTPGYTGAPTPGAYGDQPTPGGFRGSGQHYQTPAAYTPGGAFPETPGADNGPTYD